MYDIEQSIDTAFSVADLARLVAAKTPFAFSRWGDGEWIAIVSPSSERANCDGHAYFPDMSQALGDVLRSRPAYILGFQLWPPKQRQPWNDWLERHDLTDLKWVPANILFYAAEKGDLSFREWPEILVGPRHLRPVFPRVQFIEVPSKNCWLETTVTLDELWKTLAESREHKVVGFCASMAANVWIDRTHAKFPQHTCIDFGAAFDPLAGLESRSYMRWPRMQAIYERHKVIASGA